MDDMFYTVADQDYYLPPHRMADAGASYLPSGIPASWARATRSVWTVWTPPGAVLAEHGWKVHVSARYERAQHVLDTFAEICSAEGVAFKHLSASLFFMLLHHKHASRVQAGKFCVAYPPDVPAARRLMERLSEALRDEEGPFILTDRRYGQSRTVHYRYGAFTGRSQLMPDGSKLPVVEDGHGRLVQDRRMPMFTLPDGITDPFASPGEPGDQDARPEAAPAVASPITLGGYQFDKPLRFSNAGGTYRGKALASGREVFIKEARAHNGLSWDGSTAPDRLRREHAVLSVIHGQAPALCPEPLDYFREWEHDFLVTEFIAGTPLTTWVATQNPFLRADQDRGRYRDYYDRCLAILDGLAAALDGLHRIGYAFIDVNPGNVLVDEAGSPRLVDFEAASRLDGPVHLMAAPGYSPPGTDPAQDPVVLDAYGLSALALFCLLPLHQSAQRCPATLRHLRRELDEHCPVPERLWRLITRFHTPRFGTASHAARLPSPAAVARDPRTHLAGLRDAVADALTAMADQHDPDALFPTVPRGHATNTLCLAYGTAGVVHALHSAGREMPRGVAGRLRADAMRYRAELPPGLHVGSAGLAWVLAELGWYEEAGAVLAAAGASPLAGARATLGEGTAGIGMTHLALYHRTGDAGQLNRAAGLADAIPRGPALVDALGPDDAIGLLHGRAGIALFLHYLAQASGDDTYQVRGSQLLDEELARAIPLPDGELSFPDSAVRRRAMPYLFAGSAGVLFTAARYLGHRQDDPLLLRKIQRIRRDVVKTHTALAGLYPGLAGLGFTLAEYADLTGDEQAAAQAMRIGRGLFKYAVPGSSGVRMHGDRTLRFSADLWSGSAGVLLFLDRLLSGRRDAFFTFDAVPAGAASDLELTPRAAGA